MDNQWSFKHGALYEFGKRDNHIDADGKIISRKTIEALHPETKGWKTYTPDFEVPDEGLDEMFHFVKIMK